MSKRGETVHSEYAKESAAEQRGVNRATDSMTDDDLVDELRFIVREREQRPDDFDGEITTTIAIAADRVEALTLVVEVCLGALKGMLRHSCVADAHPEDKDPEDHVAERTARHAISKAENVVVPDGGWLDISTAPTAGPAFLVYCPDRHNVYLVIRHAGELQHFSPGGDPLRETPSHWMPLPSGRPTK